MRNNLTIDNGLIDYNARCRRLGQRGVVLWLTGLSGSGKSTITAALEERLYQQGYLAYRLDGDNIRHGLNKDLGFSKEQRNENIRRVAEVASLFRDAGLITLVSLITPLDSMREMAKKLIGKEHYKEIYVHADIETCVQRDPKGLYKKAFNKEITQFTGISDSFEIPKDPNKILDTTGFSVEECAEDMMAYLMEIKCIGV